MNRQFSFEEITKSVIHKEPNKSLEVGYYSCSMKLANVTPVCKKNQLKTANYQPVSIPPKISKLFESRRFNICKE